MLNWKAIGVACVLFASTLLAGEKEGRPPFIAVREVFSCCPNSGYWNELSPELKKKYFMCEWSEERVRRHLKMLQAFGFNSIQVSANPLTAVYANVDPKQWRQQVILTCRTAHELGMTVTQFVWGSAVCDREGDHWNLEFYKLLDWNKPADRMRLDRWYADQVELAPYVDRVVTHWVDPGGPGGKNGTIDTAIEMHNTILALFRKTNPQIRGIFSVWSFNDPDEPHWPGYGGPAKLAAKKTLDPKTDIALGVSNRMAAGLDPDPDAEVRSADLAGIAASGRQAALWGWYTTDIEIEPAFHVRTTILQNYFRSLPPLAHTTVAWHSVDDNCPGINMQNLYVAGHLMQDPSLDAQKLLDEFAVGFVGASNAAVVARALRTIEQTRTRSRNYDFCAEDFNPGARQRMGAAAWSDLPPSWLPDSLAAVDVALHGLTTVKLAPDFSPAWPVTMEPADYLGELKAHLESIRQMLVFLKGLDGLRALKAAGAPADTLKAAMNKLPVVVADPAHTAGLEANVYRQKLAALQKLIAKLPDQSM